MVDDPTLGQFLRHCRIKKNVSLEQAAHYCLMDRSGLGKIEKDQVSPRPSTLADLFTYYNTSQEDFEKFKKNHVRADLGRGLFAQLEPGKAANQHNSAILEKINFLVDLGLPADDCILGLNEILDEGLLIYRRREAEILQEMEKFTDFSGKVDEDRGEANLHMMSTLFFGLNGLRKSIANLEMVQIAARRMKPENYATLMATVLNVLTEQPE